MRIDVVSFQWPVPANYGGVIDVYHKIRALREVGGEVALHSYVYRDRKTPDLSVSPADVSFTYPRDMKLYGMVRQLPFIVGSRRSRKLLDNLASLPKGSPILFEGLHTCAFLSHPSLKDKVKIVRTHNVEHDYYNQLAAKEKGLKRIYLKNEARKLKRFEKILEHADTILAISPADFSYFTHRFPKVKVLYLPCFYDDSVVQVPREICRGNYVLYHGSLGVPENSKAADYIVNELVPNIGPDVYFKIAGRGTPASLRSSIDGLPNVELIDSPTDDEMKRLVSNAAVTLLITDQNTGIKLKLLDTIALSNGKIVANSAMVGDESLRPLLTVADSPDEQVKAIVRGLASQPSCEELNARVEVLHKHFNTTDNAKKILALLSQQR